jgi:hypothetical protein
VFIDSTIQASSNLKTDSESKLPELYGGLIKRLKTGQEWKKAKTVQDHELMVEAKDGAVTARITARFIFHGNLVYYHLDINGL